MKFRIEHEIRGRMRIHVHQKRMTCREADILQYALCEHPSVLSVKVYERRQDAVVCYTGERQKILDILCAFRYENAKVPQAFLQNSGRELQQEYWDKLVNRVVFHFDADHGALSDPRIESA